MSYHLHTYWTETKPLDGSVLLVHVLQQPRNDGFTILTTGRLLRVPGIQRGDHSGTLISLFALVAICLHAAFPFVNLVYLPVQSIF